MKKHFTYSFPTLLRLLALLCILPLAVGCSSYSQGSRPPEEIPEEQESLPTMGNGEPTPTNKKLVALTFDDGPQYANEGKNTVALVDKLNQYGFHATFFVIGNRIGSGEALTYAVQNGNEIGIHAYTHAKGIYYDECSDSTYEHEINKTRDTILSVLPDYQIRLMRPIGGMISAERVQSSPYSVILWDVDSDDWNHRYSPHESDEESAQKVNAIVENVMSNVKNGSIILLHDIYQSSYDAAVIILQRLYEEGYEVVTVSELLGSAMTPGQLYRSAN